MRTREENAKTRIDVCANMVTTLTHAHACLQLDAFAHMTPAPDARKFALRRRS